jgi:hypothetical protein
MGFETRVALLGLELASGGGRNDFDSRPRFCLISHPGGCELHDVGFSLRLCLLFTSKRSAPYAYMSSGIRFARPQRNPKVRYEKSFLRSSISTLHDWKGSRRHRLRWRGRLSREIFNFSFRKKFFHKRKTFDAFHAADESETRMNRSSRRNSRKGIICFRRSLYQNSTQNHLSTR